MDPTTDPQVQQQATAIAEAILPQLDARVQQRMEAQLSAQVRSQLEELGILDAQGALIVRPPADPGAADRRSRPFADYGSQLQAIHRAALPNSAPDPRLSQISAAALGMSEGVGADGGFLVQSDFIDDIMRLTHDTALVFGRIPPQRIIPLSGNSNGAKLPAIDETSRADGSRFGGVRAYWTAEAASMTASRPTIKRVNLELDKITVLSYVTDEDLEDAARLEALVRSVHEEEFGFKLDDGCIRGTGAGMPLGILNAASRVTVAKEAGQAARTVLYQNVSNMWSRMWARSRANSVWFINQDAEPQLNAMSLVIGTGGIPVYMPPSGAAGSPFGTLFGRPVVPIEQCSTVGTEGDIILADMSQYWGITKGGTRYASSIHVAFLTNETAFRGTLRIDLRPMWTSALTPYQGTNTVSPFITLANRA